MSIIYLQIAGYNIRLIYHYPRIIHRNQRMKYRLPQTIQRFCGGFLLSVKPRKIDYHIHIYSSHPLITKKHTKNSTYNFLYLYESKSNTINTFFTISISQFLLILTEIIRKLLPKDQGFLLHCSGCLNNNEALLFTGRSGAGKSTITKLLRSRYQTLVDDTVIIKKKYDRYWCYQLPLMEKNYRIKRGYRGFALSLVFFIHKSLKYNTEKITDKEYIFSHLVKQIRIDRDQQAENTQALLQFVLQFSNFHHLWFRKNGIRLIRFLEGNTFKPLTTTCTIKTI